MRRLAVQPTAARRRRRSLVAVFVAVLLFVGDALTAENTIGNSRLRFVHMDSLDGLSHESVYSIARDPQGFLWFGTEDGLNRFDGRSLKIYQNDPADPSSLAGSDINPLLADRDGMIWIGTWGSGLDRFDPGAETFTHFRPDPSDPEALSGDRIHALAQTRDGTIWVGTYQNGLNRLVDPINGRFERFLPDPKKPFSFPSDHVWDIVEDPAGGLWVATDHGLCRFDRETGRCELRHTDAPEENLRISHNQVRGLSLDDVGRLWICTADGLDVLDLTDGTMSRDVLPLSPDAGPATFKEVLQDRRGRYWIATKFHGLIRWDQNRDQITFFSRNDADPEGMRHNDVRALHQDASGNLWIATRGGGVHRVSLRPPLFRTLTRRSVGEATKLTAEDVWAIHETRDGVLWVGSGVGLDRFGTDGSMKHFPRDHIVQALLEDQDGSLWVGTQGGGLERLDASGERLEQFVRRPGDRKSLGDDSIWTLLLDSEGALWIGADDNGLDRLQDGVFTHFAPDPNDPTSLPHGTVLALAEDTQNRLWVGTGDGLARLIAPASGQFLRFRHDADRPRSLSNNRVTAIHQDRRGSLWVATHGGLNRLLGENEFERFGRTEGLPSNILYDILEDEDGRLWLPSNRGLARLDPVEREVRNYGLEDGLLGLGFHEGAAFRSAAGRMYAGGTRGLIVFEPKAIVENLHVPPVVITKLEIDNSPYDLPRAVWATKSVELPPDTKLLRLDFASLDFTAPERNRYEYRMSGLNDAWSPVETPTALFAGLTPGRYTFEVRASNNDGIWNEEGASLTILMPTHWWKTWQFRTLAAGLLLAVVFFIDRARMRAARRQSLNLTLELEARSKRLVDAEGEIQRFASIISHDLRSPLVTLQGFLGVLRAALSTLRDRVDPVMDQLPDEDRRVFIRAFQKDVPQALDFLESSAKRLDTITGAVIKLARLTGREMELETIDLDELVDRLIAGLEHEIRQSGVAIEVGVLPKLTADLHALERVLENLIGNAIKYLDADRPGRIIVRAEKRQREIAITVRDNGRGIAEDDVSKVFDMLRRVGKQDRPGEGMGLSYVQALVRRMGGEIECASEFGKGSTFTVVLPRYPEERPEDSSEIAAP